MPRDKKTPLIQEIAERAYTTFKGCESSANGDNTQSELISLVTAVRAVDLNIAPRKSSASCGDTAPVTYMHICETEVFSMGVFLLGTGASIPLHDHPGMNGMLKVLYGKVSVRCLDKLEESPILPPFEPALAAFQTASVRRSVLRSVCEYSEDSGPCLLTPLRDNLHQIHALEGPAAFLDILAPPYNPDDGRDCHYYQPLQTVAGHGQEEGDTHTWLLEVPQPEDFWCGGEPYPGPKVSF